MRKTMGATRRQLLGQFLVESLVIASIAMVVAIAALEMIIPLLNNAANKALTIDYLRTLPWLVLTTVVVGLVAGAYPAWLITRATPIEALREVLTANGRTTVGEPIWARYDPPWKPWFLRRNEVLVPVGEQAGEST